VNRISDTFYPAQVTLLFSWGEAVLYREMWQGAEMTVLPMRVVSDAPDRTVLYLAPETAFRAARTPAGGKVSDLADWIATDAVWTGGSLLRLLEPKAWHCVDVEFDASGDFAGWYINFQEPLRRTPSGFDTADLVLDLVVAPDGAWHLKDEDDFERAVSDGHLSRDIAARVRAEAGQMAERVDAGGSPFDERRWCTWRPPPDWIVPSLTTRGPAD
jgi:Protein of unknown function (DUF402)